MDSAWNVWIKPWGLSVRHPIVNGTTFDHRAHFYISHVPWFGSSGPGNLMANIEGHRLWVLRCSVAPDWSKQKQLPHVGRDV